ncbi:Ser/Thr protein kinase [Eptesipox virus]|uniref:Serine/threonine-protein kinase n=1 Tax=Eptesipox virus TaxID=1329402 RepID=A0A220T692_9POXV|nr:Ser/Thr protein kinase [Eptesipox virus]ASK51227.1 Ser/Thr protein kinase [Eptesipox virus]
MTADDASPDYQWFSPVKVDSTILGDEIYFSYAMSQIDINQSWTPNVRLLKYFKNFNIEILNKICNSEYVNPSFFQQKDERFLALNDDLYHISTGGYGIVFRLDNYVIKFVYELNKQFSPIDTTTEYTIPKFLVNNLKGDEKKLIVCALAMGLNYNLSFLHSLYKRVLHMLVYLIQIMDNQKLNLHYSHKLFLKSFLEKKSELNFVKLISYFYPTVIQSNINIINNFTHIFHFFEHEKRSNFAFDRGNIIIFPLAKCSADKVTEHMALSFGFSSLVEYTKFLFLQMALLYIKIYELPHCDNFIHVDLKPDNILLFNETKPLTIKFKTFTFTFKESIRAALNDFDFSKVATIQNKKVNASIKIEHNWYYDFHFFTHTLLKTYPEIEEDEEFKNALYELIMSCSKTTCEKYRLRVSILHPISFLEKFVTRNIFSHWLNGE